MNHKEFVQSLIKFYVKPEGRKYVDTIHTDALYIYCRKHYPEVILKKLLEKIIESHKINFGLLDIPTVREIFINNKIEIMAGVDIQDEPEIIKFLPAGAEIDFLMPVKIEDKREGLSSMDKVIKRIKKK